MTGVTTYARRFDRAAGSPARTAYLLAGLLGLLALLPARGQTFDEGLRITVREDNQDVYLYHTALPPVGHGFNVYRRYQGESDFVKLNEEPVRGVASGAELRALLGTRYEAVEQATGQSGATGTFARLRSDRMTANLLTFVYPEIAEALGRLYVDRSARLDEVATYRLEFVDGLNTPTDQVIERTLLLLPRRPDAPTGLRAQNDERSVTLFWRYVSPNPNEDDTVIRFEAFRIEPGTGQSELLHDHVVVRNDALFEYALTVDLSTMGQTEQFYVRSLDITGQASDPSPVLRYAVTDPAAPPPPGDVAARPTGARGVEVIWTAGDSDDLTGYHVYRGSRLDDPAAAVRLTNAPLDRFETRFVDTEPPAHPSGPLFYSVRALDGNGNEGAAGNAAMVLLPDRTAPSPPDGLDAAYQDDGTVRLTWNGVEDAADLQTYVVLRRRLGRGAAPIDARSNLTDFTTPSFIDQGEAGRGFAEGAVYQFTVLAADSARNFSEPATVRLQIPDWTPPAPPPGLRTDANDGTRARIVWNPSASQDVAAYVLYRQATGSTALETRRVPAGQRLIEDESVQTGRTYLYWITAIDAAGNESARSTPDTLFMRDFSPPRSVRNVRVQGTETGTVHLRWEPVPASDLAGYRIYRAAHATGPFVPAHEGLLNDTQWIDAGGQRGVWYEIRAVDRSGNESLPCPPVRVAQQPGN